MDVIEVLKKKGVGLGGRVGGGQGGCDRRIEENSKKKIWGGGVWEVRVDVNEELKFCENSKKNWGWGEGSDWGVGLEGVRVDVIEELKFLGKFTKKKFFLGGGWGGLVWGRQGGCERRIEVFVKIKKNIFFWGGGYAFNAVQGTF